MSLRFSSNLQHKQFGMICKSTIELPERKRPIGGDQRPAFREAKRIMALCVAIHNAEPKKELVSVFKANGTVFAKHLKPDGLTGEKQILNQAGQFL